MKNSGGSDMRLRIASRQSMVNMTTAEKIKVAIIVQEIRQPVDKKLITSFVAVDTLHQAACLSSGEKAVESRRSEANTLCLELGYDPGTI